MPAYPMSRTTPPALRLALMLLILFTGAATAAGPATTRDLAQTVNTFIGTQDEGNTFPGASAPFGLEIGQAGYRSLHMHKLFNLSPAPSGPRGQACGDAMRELKATRIVARTQ